MTTHRRGFLKSTALTGGLTLAPRFAGANSRRFSANDTIVVGVMGVNGRGRSLAAGFARQPGCEVGYVCDVDERVVGKGVQAVDGIQKTVPKSTGDLRVMLEAKDVDVLVVATPNHWHAPATILGCTHGKHVYVEKPCSHTPWEGEMAVKAARKHDRVVTMGSQRRSRAPIREAIQRLHEGEIGEIRYVRCWYANRRGSIGRGKEVAVPQGLDFGLWQGPCTRQPYRDNLLHYNWHWRWHWGNGELGNNGVHALDVARWGMQVDYPTRVASMGGRFCFEDDQETPDTHAVTFEFGDRMIHWEGLSCSPFGPYDSGFGLSFHGSSGMLLLSDSGYRVQNQGREVVAEVSGSGGDAEHFDDFLACIRDGGRPSADIEEGHKSTLLCHLGNISARVGRIVETDAANGHILGDSEAADLWTKDYEADWTPSV